MGVEFLCVGVNSLKRRLIAEFNKDREYTNFIYTKIRGRDLAPQLERKRGRYRSRNTVPIKD